MTPETQTALRERLSAIVIGWRDAAVAADNDRNHQRAESLDTCADTLADVVDALLPPEPAAQQRCSTCGIVVTGNDPEHAGQLLYRHIVAHHPKQPAAGQAQEPKCVSCGWIGTSAICGACGRERDSGILPLDSPLRRGAPQPVPAQEPGEPTCRTHGDPLFCAACEVEEDRELPWLVERQRRLTAAWFMGRQSAEDRNGVDLRRQDSFQPADVKARCDRDIAALTAQPEKPKPRCERCRGARGTAQLRGSRGYYCDRCWRAVERPPAPQPVPAQDGPARKPFKLDVSKEWCVKMATLEEGHDVSAGGAQDGPEPSVETEIDALLAAGPLACFETPVAKLRHARACVYKLHDWKPAPALPPHQDVEALAREMWEKGCRYAYAVMEMMLDERDERVLDDEDVKWRDNDVRAALARRAPADQGPELGTVVETGSVCRRCGGPRRVNPEDAGCGTVICRFDSATEARAALQRARETGGEK